MTKLKKQKTSLTSKKEIESKNNKLLMDFSFYCIKHPEQRFWQALRNWSKSPFILKAKKIDLTKEEITYLNIENTFYEE